MAERKRQHDTTNTICPQPEVCVYILCFKMKVGAENETVRESCCTGGGHTCKCTCSARSLVKRCVVSLLSWSPLLSSTTLLACRVAERAVILGLKVQSGSCCPAA